MHDPYAKVKLMVRKGYWPEDTLNWYADFPQEEKPIIWHVARELRKQALADINFTKIGESGLKFLGLYLYKMEGLTEPCKLEIIQGYLELIKILGLTSHPISLSFATRPNWPSAFPGSRTEGIHSFKNGSKSYITIRNYFAEFAFDVGGHPMNSLAKTLATMAYGMYCARVAAMFPHVYVKGTKEESKDFIEFSKVEIVEGARYFIMKYLEAKLDYERVQGKPYSENFAAALAKLIVDLKLNEVEIQEGIRLSNEESVEG